MWVFTELPARLRARDWRAYASLAMIVLCFALLFTGMQDAMATPHHERTLRWLLSDLRAYIAAILMVACRLVLFAPK